MVSTWGRRIDFTELTPKERWSKGVGHAGGQRGGSHKKILGTGEGGSPGFHKCHRKESLKKMRTCYPRIPLLEIYPKEKLWM